MKNDEWIISRVWYIYGKFKKERRLSKQITDVLYYVHLDYKNEIDEAFSVFEKIYPELIAEYFKVDQPNSYYNDLEDMILAISYPMLSLYDSGKLSKSFVGRLKEVLKKTFSPGLEEVEDLFLIRCPIKLYLKICVREDHLGELYSLVDDYTSLRFGPSDVMNLVLSIINNYQGIEATAKFIKNNMFSNENSKLMTAYLLTGQRQAGSLTTLREYLFPYLGYVSPAGGGQFDLTDSLKVLLGFDADYKSIN